MALFRFLLLLSLLAPLTYRAASDDGRGIDPNGRPVSASRTCDEGNGLDPHGSPCTNNAFDVGPRMDPNG